MSEPGANPAANPAVPPPNTVTAPDNPSFIEVDEAFLAKDAFEIDDRLSSNTASLTSSIIDYPEEYGGRYHVYQSCSYQFPNGKREMDRLDLSHSLVVRTTGGLFLAPIDKDKTHRILDVGTGTGIWAIEVGDKFPNAEVVGTDLSAIQPEFVPPKVTFEIDDAESAWVGPTLLFESDDGSLRDNHETMKWKKMGNEIADQIGRDFSPGPKLHNWTTEASFRNVTHEHYKIPKGPWPKDPHYKDLGMLNLVQLMDGLEAFTLRPFARF
ncbi:putative TAM domain methyltransferase [Colletotrichum sublineola]|uniref:Putative TAM domain methyltransferase n=1 Tax=Colletotrichum sublineola TaxID=1173701 RepID=A0A066WTU9_COLSU|nr:putative TAM domain methyltransferase [Colletotrichum sublineola]